MLALVAQRGEAKGGIGAFKDVQFAEGVNAVVGVDRDGEAMVQQHGLGLGEGLGIYESQILELVSGVNQTQEKGRESVELLTTKVKKMAADVEAMVSAGLA